MIGTKQSFFCRSELFQTSNTQGCLQQGLSSPTRLCQVDHVQMKVLKLLFILKGLLFRIWSGRVRHPADVHQSWIPGCWSILDHSEGPVCRREKRSTFSHWGHRPLSWIQCAQFPWEALWRWPRPWNSWIPTLILLPRGLKLLRRQSPCPWFNHNVEPQEAKTWGRQVHRWEQRDRLHDQEWAIPLHNFGLWPPSGYSSGHFSY